MNETFKPTEIIDNQTRLIIESFNQKYIIVVLSFSRLN